MFVLFAFQVKIRFCDNFTQFVERLSRSDRAFYPVQRTANKRVGAGLKSIFMGFGASEGFPDYLNIQPE